MYVAWINDTARGNKFYEVHFSSSDDHGETWGAPVKVAGSADTKCYGPQLGVRGSDDVCLFWSEKHGADNWQIHFAHSTDGGTTWTEPATIAAGEPIGRPQIALGKGEEIYVAWADVSKGNGDVCVSRSTDNGAHWQAVEGVPNNMNKAISPVIAVDSKGCVHVAWEEEAAGNSEIFLTRSTNGGNSWFVPVNASTSPGYSRKPNIAVDAAGKLYIVWLDKVPPQRGLEKSVVRFARES